MTSISIIEYIYKLDDIVYVYNNAYHRTIKMKHVNVKSRTYIDFNKEINKEGSKLKGRCDVRIPKYKNILQKPMFQIGLRKFCDQTS